MALQLGAVEGVCGERGALEAVPYVGEVSDPAQVYWNGVEGHEEATEQQERHRHHRREEHAVLEIE